MKIAVIHGPNLNLLGKREPDIYGTKTLMELNQEIENHFADKNELKFFQSNHEGAIIDFLHDTSGWSDAFIINPAAYTHTSYAIRDAISAINVPCVEVHLSDINKRESFRKTSVIKPVCVKQISGLGFQSYISAIKFLLS